MRILDNAVIDEQVDAVVVGAGIGGLTAAALLANRGLTVLAVEQHYIPGGCCTSLRRRDMAFDVGAALLYGFGEGGYNPHRFVMNELEEPIDMIRHESILRMNFDGKQVTFWRDFDRYFRELAAAFPHEERGLRALYGRMQAVLGAIAASRCPAPPTEMHWMDGLRGFLRSPLGTLRMGMTLGKTARQVLERYVHDPEVIGFFNILTATMFCCTTDELPALLAATVMADAHVGGACYPAGSPQMLPNKLERALERHGGRILYRHRVEEILLDGRTARGVRLDDGTVVRADHVVSATTVWNLYGGLIPPRHVSPGKLRRAQSFVPTFSVLMLYIGVDREAVPEGARPVEFFVADWHDLASDNMIVYIPSLDDPSICPPDAHSLTVAFSCYVEGGGWPRPGEPGYRSEAYYARKEQEADKALDLLERHFPGLREHIRVLEVGTPSTIERFTLRKHGCIGGPKQMMGQELLRRPRARCEFKRLYLCGDSTVMGEGVVAATASAVGAANMVLRDRGQPEYRPRRHARQYVRLVEGAKRTPLPSAEEPVSAQNAPRLAAACQMCESPKCMESCPAGIDAQSFVRRIEAGNVAGAARAVREMNPLAEACGAVCPAERFCQKQCNRLEFDAQATRIRELHGWAAAQAGDEGWDRTAAPPQARRVAVVGAGPAGLTCAHYLARLGYPVDIYEEKKAAGGMLSHAIPRSRLPDELVERELGGLTLPGMRFLFGRSLGKDLRIEDLERDYDAVFLAPGLWKGRKLDIPGLPAARQTDALELLKDYRGKGTVKTGRKVLVIGGGSVAVDAAVAVRESGAEQVTLVCLEEREAMPCLPSEAAGAEARGIEIVNGWGPHALGSPGELTFAACVSLRDADGAFRPVLDPCKTMTQAFDQVVTAVGQTTVPALAEYLKSVFGDAGRIVADEATRAVSSRPRLYAGGDIARGAGTVVQAVGDGRRAAMAMDAMLRGLR